MIRLLSMSGIVLSDRFRYGIPIFHFRILRWNLKKVSYGSVDRTVSNRYGNCSVNGLAKMGETSKQAKCTVRVPTVQKINVPFFE